ncbi:hypothetical protein ACIPUC_09000 [Streptomyces sp. LARHCF249]
MGGAVAAVSAAFWAGVPVGMSDGTMAAREEITAAAWASAAIPYVRITAAREAERIRAGGAR